MSKVDRSYQNPQVDLDIEGVLIPQTVIDFGSQVNVLPKNKWMKLGHLELLKSYFYINLTNQCLVEPLCIWKYAENTIMGI